jgi:hypothetical protein
MQRDFVTRGLASRDAAGRTGKYHAAADVHTELEAMLAETGKAKGAR